MRRFQRQERNRQPTRDFLECSLDIRLRIFDCNERDGGMNQGNPSVDCRLLDVMGRDFVSALQPVAYCTVPG
jgi:hypothetical protein